jgi:hypothetical protein
VVKEANCASSLHLPFIHKAAIGPAEVAFKQCQPSDKQLTRSQHETGSGDQLASAAAPRAEPGDGGLQLQVIHVRREDT